LDWKNRLARNSRLRLLDAGKIGPELPSKQSRKLVFLPKILKSGLERFADMDLDVPLGFLRYELPLDLADTCAVTESRFCNGFLCTYG
jgi:hypothetical protein